MSSADRDDVLAGQLIERLLIDPRFRAEFRRDPAAASMEAGLPDLAAELAGSAGSMDTLVVRESRSSLAGVVMAVAVEGIGVAEARALMHHGVTGAPRGLKLPHGSAALRNPLGHVGHGHVSGSLQHELRGLQHAGSPAHATGGGSAASSAPASTASAAPPDSSPSAGSPAASASAPSAGVAGTGKRRGRRDPRATGAGWACRPCRPGLAQPARRRGRYGCERPGGRSRHACYRPGGRRRRGTRHTGTGTRHARTGTSHTGTGTPQPGRAADRRRRGAGVARPAGGRQRRGRWRAGWRRRGDWRRRGTGRPGGIAGEPAPVGADERPRVSDLRWRGSANGVRARLCAGQSHDRAGSGRGRKRSGARAGGRHRVGRRAAGRPGKPRRPGPGDRDRGARSERQAERDRDPMADSLAGLLLRCECGEPVAPGVRDAGHGQFARRRRRPGGERSGLARSRPGRVPRAGWRSGGVSRTGWRSGRIPRAGGRSGRRASGSRGGAGRRDRWHIGGA